MPSEASVSADAASAPTARVRVAAARAELAAIGAGNPGLEADLLMAEALGTSRLALLRGPDRALDAGERARFESLLARRLARAPLQHVLGRTEFYGLEIATPPGVFIPRPETETLVDAVLDGLGERALFADIGTGTGAVALAILSRRPDARALASDVSPLAVETARANARRLGSHARIDVRHGDGLDPFEPLDLPLDALVSNPPYIRERDLASLPPEVRDHEPREALAGGADGLDSVRRLVEAAPRALRSGGVLAFEIGYDQAAGAAEVLASEPRLGEIEVVPDLGGRPRVIRAKRR